MKAILVIDMPRNCWGCPCNEVDSDGMSWCNALAKNTIHSNVERQPWCPLRPLPAKTGQSAYCKDIAEACRLGWDMCIDTITGETE